MSAKRSAASPSSPRRGESGGGSATGGEGSDKPKKSLRRRILTWVLLIGLGLFVLVLTVFAYFYYATDIPDPNEEFETQTSFVYYADGKTEVGRFATQDRQSIGLDEVPEHVQDAVIAAENRKFYTDSGIDPPGIVRAAFNNATSDSTQGASTITQQYVKVLYLSQEQTLSRKAKEALLSLKVQREMEKSEILEGYLNTIYFGRGSYGIQAAAQAFFDKDAEDLNVREGAVLASVLNSPGNMDPANGQESKRLLRDRYEYVLSGMAEMGAISAQTAESAASKLPSFPKIEQQDTYGGQRGHILTLVRQQLRAQGFSSSEIDGGGLRVTTTFTRKAVNAAARAVRQERPPGLGQLHVAVASVEPGTGALRGIYGGQDYLRSQIDWAVAGGQPGSTFKAFAVAAAIKDGFSLKDTFEGNSPYTFPDGTDFENQGDQDYGSAISMLTATEDSVNTAFVDMTVSMSDGPAKIVDTAVDFGIPRSSPGLEPGPAVALGSATVSPIDMANGYATLANEGKAAQWYVIEKVRSDDGKELFTRRKKSERVVSADISADTSYALEQVVQSGSGTAALALGRPAAGKTGTATVDNGDVSSSWFVGYTPQLSTAVMYVRGDGNDALDGYMPDYFGGSYPAQTWTSVMQGALEGTEVLDFPAPVFVDGEAPNSGHDPVPTFTPEPTPESPEPPPEPTKAPPKPTKTKAPTPTPKPSREPSPTEPEPPVIPTPTPESSSSGPSGGPSSAPEEDGAGARGNPGGGSTTRQG